MSYTIMKEFPDDGSDYGGSQATLVDGYMAIATSDFGFIILRISGK